MKILVISDTHRDHKNLEEVLEKEKPVDLLIHLGDAEGAEDYIEAIAECPMEVVAGNCDFFSKLPAEMIIDVGSKKALITHGHYYSVNVGLANIKKEAEGRGCDMVMFGHTHRPMIEKGKDLIVMNPGSLSYPRQDGKRPSYILMEEIRGEWDIQLKYV